MRYHSRKVVLITLVATFAAGCATTEQGSVGPMSGQPGSERAAQEKDPCSVGSSAVAGAIFGALIGAATDGAKGAIRGAAAGGVVATLGCLAINSQSRQTRTAAQVDSDYVRARGRLPDEPRVVSYVPRLASATAQRGQAMKVTSVVELVNGAKTNVNEVREELVIFDPEGKPFKNGSKPLTNNSGGRFENSFEVTLPKSASQGVYAMKTNLYVNGRLAETRDLRTQLVWHGVHDRMIAGR